MASKRGGSGGTRGAVASFITLVTLAGFILGWVHVNKISSATDVYNYFKAISDKYNECGLAKALLNCQFKLDTDKAGNYTGYTGSTGNTNIPNIGNDTKGKSLEDILKDHNININAPKKPTDINTNVPTTGTTKAGDAISPNVFLATLDKIKIEKSTNVPYKRSEWKHWIGEPCNTRETVLINQGKDVKVDKTSTTCKITAGTWTSPYDNVKTTNSTEFDIDHVIPLSYAAHHGGQAWPAAKKETFANDTSQLLAVSAKSNRSKSDKGPEEFMPQDTFQCQYSKIWVSTAQKYGVSITENDKDTLKRALEACK